MERHILQKFFKPQAVAVIGASPNEGSIGFTLVNNLKQDGFKVECGQAGIPGAIIISAGGKEVGDEGQKVEAEIAARDIV